jgi:NRPS condensation-like uncharacterized protein
VPSFAQQRLWMIDQLQGQSPEYNMPMAFHVSGQLDLRAVQKAMFNIIERHQVLRTVFAIQDNELVQIIRDNVEFKLTCHDLRELNEQIQQQHVASLVKQDMSTPFDLSKDIMVRAAYIQLSSQNDKGVMLFNMHHIASDGWSMGLLVKEFAAEYDAALAGTVSSVPELAIQ